MATEYSIDNLFNQFHISGYLIVVSFSKYK